MTLKSGSVISNGLKRPAGSLVCWFWLFRGGPAVGGALIVYLYFGAHITRRRKRPQSFSVFGSKVYR